MLLTARTSTPAPTRRWPQYIFSTAEVSTSTCWFVILKLTNQHQTSENGKQLDFGPPIQGWQVINSLKKTVSTHDISKTKKRKKKRPEDITKHKYSVKGGKKLSVMGRLWKTFWRTFFRGMIPIVSLFFSTVNPYLIAGRTKRSEGSRVITSFSWTWPRETSRDKLLCRRLCFFALEDVCCFCCCGICCFCRWRIISL